MTQAVKERLESRFELEPRGLIDVKGKGPTAAWYLLARDGSLDQAPARSAAALAAPGTGAEHPAASSSSGPG